MAGIAGIAAVMANDAPRMIALHLTFFCIFFLLGSTGGPWSATSTDKCHLRRSSNTRDCVPVRIFVRYRRFFVPNLIWGRKIVRMPVMRGEAPRRSASPLLSGAKNAHNGPIVHGLRMAPSNASRGIQDPERKTWVRHGMCENGQSPDHGGHQVTEQPL